MIRLLDGVEIARTNPTAKPDSTGTQPFRIGANSRSNDRYFTGDVDYVKIIKPGIGTVFWSQLKFSEYQIDILPPVITKAAKTNLQFSVSVQRVTNLSYSIWRAADPGAPAWTRLTNAVIGTDGATTVILTDPNATNAKTFYRVRATHP